MLVFSGKSRLRQVCEADLTEKWTQALCSQVLSIAVRDCVEN
jgi:hypothetical protein